MRSMDSIWAHQESLSTVGALRHQIWVTLGHLSTTPAVSSTLPGERTLDPTFEGGNRGHIPRPPAKVWLSKRFYAEYGAFRTLRVTPSGACCSYLPQFDFTMHLLDSCASRMSPHQALLTLHVDYIGGLHANYHKRYFAAQLDLVDAVGHTSAPPL